MAEKKEWRAFAELLIGEVRKHPELWDKKASSDRGQKEAAWEDVCSVVVENYTEQTEEQRRVTIKEIINKWKSYRDAHLKYLRKKRGQYVHADLLAFLEENGVFRRRKLRWAPDKNQVTQEQDSTFEDNPENSVEYPVEFIKTEFPSQWSQNQNSSSSSNYFEQPSSSFPTELPYTNHGHHFTSENSIQQKLQPHEENNAFPTQPKRLILESSRNNSHNIGNSQWPQTNTTNPSEECTKKENHQRSAQKRPLEDAGHHEKEIVFVDKDHPSLTATPVVQPASSNSATEDDDDMFFFRSLLPTVKDLTKTNKLSFRIQVLQVLQNLANNS